MISFKEYLTDEILKEAIEHHRKENIPLTECVFRHGSKKYFEFFSEARRIYQDGGFLNLTEDELELLESDLGEFGLFEGVPVPLDFIFEEEETPELNKPKRGGKAKYIVYVRDPQTKNIKKIQFGDTTGLTAKYNNPERKKAFAARHKCSEQKDKLSRAYWACRINKYLGKTPEARSGYW